MRGRHVRTPVYLVVLAGLNFGFKRFAIASRVAGAAEAGGGGKGMGSSDD